MGVRLGPKRQINGLSRRAERIPEGQLRPYALPRGPWVIWEPFFGDVEFLENLSE